MGTRKEKGTKNFFVITFNIKHKIYQYMSMTERNKRLKHPPKQQTLVNIMASGLTSEVFRTRMLFRIFGFLCVERGDEVTTH